MQHPVCLVHGDGVWCRLPLLALYVLLYSLRQHSLSLKISNPRVANENDSNGSKDQLSEATTFIRRLQGQDPCV